MNAIELADMVERYNAGVHSQAICENYLLVANELRRLHAENEQLKAAPEVKAEPEFYQVRARPLWYTKPIWTEWRICAKDAAEDYRHLKILGIRKSWLFFTLTLAMLSVAKSQNSVASTFAICNNPISKNRKRLLLHV